MTHLERRGAFTLACIAVGLLVSSLPDDTGGDFAERLERAIEPQPGGQDNRTSAGP